MIQLMTSRSNQKNTECGSHVRLCMEILKSPISVCVSLARTRRDLRAELREWFLSFFPFPVMQGAALRFRLYNRDCLCRWDVTEQLSRPDSRRSILPAESKGHYGLMTSLEPTHSEEQRLLWVPRKDESRARV